MALDILTVILLSLTAAFIVSEFFESVKLPRVLGPIVLGIIIGSTTLRDYIFVGETLETFNIFAELGLVFIMFYIGLKLDVNRFKSDRKKAVSVSIMSAALPFTLGFAAMQLFGFDIVTSLIVGAALSVTAEAISFDVLEEMGLEKTKFANTILAAGLIDDVFEVFLLAGITTLINSQSGAVQGLAAVLLNLVQAAALIIFAKIILMPAVEKIAYKCRSEVDLFISALIIGLFMAIAGRYLGIGEIVGALIAGMMLRHTLNRGDIDERHEEEKIAELFKVTTFGFLAPFFFISVGMKANFSLHAFDWTLAVVIVIIAFAGKILGSLFGAKMGGGTWKEGFTMGWAMNTKGLAELVAANLAFQAALISQQIFTTLILVTLATTIVSPPIFKYLVTKYHLVRG